MNHAAICDVCDKSITDIRYKCINCYDFDLCSTCEHKFSSRIPIHPFNHVFIKLPFPILPPKQRPKMFFPLCVSMSREDHHGIICDGCECAIIGTRFCCINCENFDLCEQCEKLGTKHDPTHVFLKTKIPLISRDDCPLLPILYTDEVIRLIRQRSIQNCTKQEPKRITFQVPAVRIRRLEYEDIPQILEIERQCFASPYNKVVFQQWLIDYKIAANIAEISINQKPTIAGYYAMELKNDEGYIISIGVSPQFQRMKIGETLMRHAMGYIKTCSLKKMSLHVNCKNIAAQKLYSKLGFKVQVWDDGYYHQEGDGLIMVFHCNK